MSDFENKSFDNEKSIKKCIEAINQVQIKMDEEEDTKRIIKITLDQIQKKEQSEIRKTNTLIGKLDKKAEFYIRHLEKICGRKKIRQTAIRMMLFLVMCIFIFNGALNKAYANQNEISGTTNAAIQNQNINKDSQNDSDSDAQESRSDDEKADKFVGVNEEGRKYSYDAVKIAEKLKKGDYNNQGDKIVFLTFDDGTSTTVTPKILKILDEYKVKATFFLMGQSIEDGGEEAKNLVKKEFENGHAIGNHSYSHDYSILYPGRTLNLESFKSDYDKNEELLKSILGENFSTRVLRCPGGYMSWKGMDSLNEYLKENNMASIDWNALSKDAEGKKKNADELVQCAIESAEGKEVVVILMHDTYGKEETAKSLPEIIKYFKNNGYEFKTLV
ncbi:polysaccharide deacetylase family protein [uncultured Clostridium sp.]|uniref:polysaccharide deacetylase family protein n=1 Tax=uncultured Clostridium sp. TaxID=59620 RepID=UPI0025D637A1|nr:polysaccharide deacetylase family protein [uncultured Clostridium sp.]